MVMESFAPLAAIGTIGDVVPLVGENRLLVRRGMQLMPMSESAGFRL